MAFINKQDTNGTKALLNKGELGYDDYVAGGDTGRVYVGNGSSNIALAKKSEVDAKLNSSTYTASDILTKLKTVDGTLSGLDADLLDGQHGSYYLPASSYTASDILNKLKTVDGAGSGLDADTVDGLSSRELGSVLGGGTDKVFVLNDQVVTTSYTIPAGKNAMTTGTVTINTGVSVTIPTGARWVII